MVPRQTPPIVGEGIPMPQPHAPLPCALVFLTTHILQTTIENCCYDDNATCSVSEMSKSWSGIHGWAQ